MKTTAKSTHGVIRFSLKEPIKSLELTPKKESLIMLHFASGGNRFKKSIGYKCPFNQWDLSKQRIKTGKGMMSNAYEVNNFISELQAHAEKELSTMKTDNNSIDLEYLSHAISCRINGSKVNKKDSDDKKVLSYSKKLLENKKNHINITTYRACNQTVKMLEKFEKKFETILKFNNIDLAFYRKFVTFLEDENYSLNSIGKHIKNLKIFLNDAVTNGVSNNVIFKSRNFKVLRETTTEVYLSEKEIKILAKKDFSNRPRIELTRDIFLIGCYTGQRVSDYNGLTNKNIEIINGHKFIKIQQKKTDTPVLIPITHAIQEVMSKYNNRFPPKLNEPILRQNIKTACSSAGFKELISVSKTKGGKLIKEDVPKYMIIKTHTARRSFCTNY